MIDFIISNILYFKQVLQSVSVGSILGVEVLVGVTLWDVSLCLFILTFLVFILSGLSEDEE